MPAPSRAPYRAADLRRLLAPTSVALVGASATPGALGTRTLANLNGFPGELYPVNPRHAELGGRRCHASLSALPEAPDCVVLAVPAESVEALVAECGARGAGAVIVLASGYAETESAEGAAAQARIVELAARCGMRVVGPNCVGVACNARGLHAAFAEFSRGDLIPGNRVALVAQSGALGMGLSNAAEHGTSISHVLTCGNSCDVDVADYVASLAEDDSCDAIALVFEGLADASRLESAAALAASHGRRIAVCKLGTSATGRNAARFHTNTAAGEAEAWSRLFSRARMIQVSRIESLIETASFLAKLRVPLTPGVAILSGSGGTGILAVDAAARHAVPTPPPDTTTQERLREAIPSFGSPRNPCDATAQATRHPASLRECADALLSDARYGALVIPWGRAQPEALMMELGELARTHRKPVCLVWMSQRLEGPLADAIERHPALSLFRSLDACFDALGQVQRLG